MSNRYICIGEGYRITQPPTWWIYTVSVAPRIARVWLRVTNIWTQRDNIIICNYRVSLPNILSMTYCYWMTFRDKEDKESEKSQAPCKIPVGLLGPGNQSGWAWTGCVNFLRASAEWRDCRDAHNVLPHTKMTRLWPWIWTTWFELSCLRIHKISEQTCKLFMENLITVILLFMV